LTDIAMTRFWLSMDAALDLVLFAITQQLTGSIIVPHLPAFRVTDLVRALIGLEAEAPLIEGRHVRLVGVRPGEKLAEDLLTSYEAQRLLWWAGGTSTPYAYAIQPDVCEWTSNGIPSGWYTAPLPIPYRSDVWPDRLSVADLRRVVDALARAA
jgi:FlaA1/EpsC-like NDP-sugar epimerase